MALKADALVPSDFTNIKAELESDKNYCAVVAVSLITKTPVQKVQAMMACHGRKIGKGTKRETTRKVIEELGFEVKEWTLQERLALIGGYPQPHNNLENITTHHPRRFPSAWVGQPDMLMFSRSHVSAYVDGIVCDWAVKHSKRVIDVWTLEKI